MAGGGVVGSFVGGILTKYIKYGAAALAGLGGFFLGLILNEAVMWQFEYKWVFWGTNGVCMLICALLTIKFFNPLIITSTSTIGAYFLVRGASCYLGHYYNEFTVINMLRAGLFD